MPGRLLGRSLGRFLGRLLGRSLGRLLGLALGLWGAPGLGAEEPSPIRILSMSDPFNAVIAADLPAFERLVGAPIALDVAGYTALRQRILLNGFAASSAYDLIAIDMGWGREIHGAALVLPLGALLAARAVDLSTYLPAARQGATVEGDIIGLPVQPHAEVLFYDRALFDGIGLAAPETTADVLALGRRLNQTEEPRRAGICWNAQRGAALGQTMLHFLAAFGGRPLDADGRASLDTPQMRAAIGYAEALVALSPPDILSMAWDARIEAFAAGRCAMTYGWTGRTRLMRSLGLELREVGVTAAPHAPGLPRVSPLGVWLLALPANLETARRERALAALLALTSEEANRLYLDGDVGALLHTTVVAAPGAAGANPALGLLTALSARGELATWMRPNIPQFQALTEILGTEVHAVLVGRQDGASAAAAAQAAFAEALGR